MLREDFQWNARLQLSQPASQVLDDIQLQAALKVCSAFQLNPRFGPRLNITTEMRWLRAASFHLDPPKFVLDALRAFPKLNDAVTC